MALWKQMPLGLLFLCVLFPCILAQVQNGTEIGSNQTIATIITYENTTKPIQNLGPNPTIRNTTLAVPAQNSNESTDDDDTTTTTNSTTSMFIPGLLKRLQEGLARVPGLNKFLNTGLGLDTSQLQTINDFVQLLVNTTSTNPVSLTDALSALQSSGLLNSIRGATGNMTSLTKHSYLWNKCQADVGLMLMGLLGNQTWATEMLDSSGKPGSSILRGNLRFMGNYIECDQVSHRDPVSSSKIEGNICRAVFPAPIKTVLSAFTATQPMIQWDLCLPKSCRDSDLNSALKQSSLGVSVYCTKDVDISDDSAAIVALCILVLFGVLLLAGTILGLCMSYNPHNISKDSVINGTANTNQGFENDEQTQQVTALSESNGKLTNPESGNLDIANDDKTMDEKYVAQKNETHEGQGNKPTTEQAPLYTWERALLAFSIPHNTEKILSVKSAAGTIGCLHGIRVLSMAWVILGHLVITFIPTVGNPVDMMEHIGDRSFQLVLNAFLSVDTFFVMSGLLTCYLFMKALGKKGKIAPKEFAMYYIHRYWRLTPSMMIWIMIVACLLKYVGEGRPAWSDFSGAENCRNNWWTNILYINNVYKREESCIGVTWFLAHDMQFYVVAPLALIPWVYGKAIIGFVVAFCYVGIHIASTIWIQLDINASMFRNRDDYSNEIYFKPYTRVAPFAIGLMLGWVLWKTKCKVRMNKCLVFFGWILCLGTILTLTLVTYEDNKDLLVGGSGWSKAERIAFETFYRPGWAIAISWLIFACATGYGGYINSILSWDGWLPLSRLTYSAYLVHLTILEFEYYLPEYTSFFTWTSLSYHFVGNFVMAYAVGYLLTVVVESPMLGLEKTFLR